MSKFKVDHMKIHSLWDTIGKLHNTLRDTSGDSLDLSTEILKSTTFAGWSKEELLAFSDLLNQYNGAFCGQSKKIISTNPTIKFNDAVSCCIFKLDNFQYYQKLKGIE